MVASSRLRLAALALATLVGGTAWASPLEDPALTRGVFGGPTQPHATSVWLDPAALGLAAGGWHLFFGATTRLDHDLIDRSQIDLDTGVLTPGAKVRSLTATPGGFLAAWWKSENAALGLASFLPQAERFIADEEALRYHTLGGFHYQWTVLALSAAFRWNKFWFGLGVGLGNMHTLRLEFARDTALEAGTTGLETDCGGAPCGVENDAAAQRYRVDVATGGSLRPWHLSFWGALFSSENLSLNAGIVWQPNDDWVVALSYQGSVGLFGSSRRLEGQVRVESAPIDGGLILNGNAEVGYNLPETLNLGARMHLPGRRQWELVTGLRMQTFFTHDNLDLRMFGSELVGRDVPEQYPLYRGFRTVFRLEAGVERTPAARVRLGARLFLERGAVRDNGVQPMAIAGANVGLSGGVEWRVAAPLVLGLGYAFTWFPSVTVDNSAFDPRDRVACVDSGYDLEQCQAVREGRARPSASGTYLRLQHAFIVSARWDFL